MKMSEAILPINSVLLSDTIEYDYIDSFQSSFMDKDGTITSNDIGKTFFMSGPKWIDILFDFRNKLVGLFGLKTSMKITDRQKLLNNFKGEEGDRLGLFKVYHKTADEIVIGEDDKHLNFRVSLFINKHKSQISNKQLTLITTVKFNNWFGRFYFFLILPFHNVIVPTMLKGIIKNIENRNELTVKPCICFAIYL